MSQQNILDVLEKIGKPISVSEIAKLIDDECYKISKQLRRMLKFNEVCFVEIDKDEAMKRYKCKHRMRLWIINGDY